MRALACARCVRVLKHKRYAARLDADAQAHARDHAGDEKAGDGIEHLRARDTHGRRGVKARAARRGRASVKCLEARGCLA
eukprot:5766770-Pleurochrysis_carterae.AAC.1